MAYGEEKAVHDAFAAGANGFIMVDLPPEEAIAFREKCTKAKWVASIAVLSGFSVNVIVSPMSH